MSTYKVLGLDNSGARAAVIIEAGSEPEARQIALARKIEALSVQLLKEGGPTNKVSNNPLNIKQIYSFCDRLAPLMQMEIPTRTAVGFIASNSPDPAVRAVALQIQEKMESMALSEAIKAVKRFPPMVEGLLKVGGDSADLPAVFMVLARFYGMIIRLKSSIRNSMIQPVMALIILVVFAFITIFVTVPRITQLLGSLDFKPTGFIGFMLSVVNVMNYIWPLFVLAFIIGLILCFTDNPLRRGTFEFLVKKFQMFRLVFHGLRQTSLLYAIHILFRAQVPHGQVMNYLLDVVRNSPMEQQMHDAAEYHAREGRFVRALEKYVDLDPEIIFTLKVGEDTSTLPEQAEKIAAVYEAQTMLAAEALSTKIAPVIIVITALFAIMIFFVTFGSILSVCNQLMRGGA